LCYAAFIADADAMIRWRTISLDFRHYFDILLFHYVFMPPLAPFSFLYASPATPDAYACLRLIRPAPDTLQRCKEKEAFCRLPHRRRPTRRYAAPPFSAHAAFVVHAPAPRMARADMLRRRVAMRCRAACGATNTRFLLREDATVACPRRKP